MKLKELYEELEKIGLRVVWDVEARIIFIGSPNFANPILWFNPYTQVEEYQGTVNIKAINAPLFSEKQIKKSLSLVNEFLMTPLKERDLQGEK